MKDSKNMHEILDFLQSLDARIEAVHEVLVDLENRMGKIEHLIEKDFTKREEDSFRYSRALAQTLENIKLLEKKFQRGVLAKQLTRVLNLQLSTIYDHLSKLEEAELIFWQRGNELGLKPNNAKFYSVTKRDETLDQMNVLIELPDDIGTIAQFILKSGEKGISKDSLLNKLKNLQDEEESLWKELSLSQIENRLENALHRLLQQVLIRKEKTLEGEIYYPWENLKNKEA